MQRYQFIPKFHLDRLIAMLSFHVCHHVLALQVLNWFRMLPLESRTGKLYHIIPILAALHWHPIPIRSDPKLLMMPYKSVKSLALILLLYIIQWAVLSLNESLNLSVIVCVCLTDEKRQSAYLWLTVYFSKFCFCVLYGTLPTILKKLQYIHNSATLPLTHPITPVLQNLIRLTVNQQIHLRLLLITYKALNKIGSPLPDQATPLALSGQLMPTSCPPPNPDQVLQYSLHGRIHNTAVKQASKAEAMTITC